MNAKKTLSYQIKEAFPFRDRFLQVKKGNKLQLGLHDMDDISCFDISARYLDIDMIINMTRGSHSYER